MSETQPREREERNTSSGFIGSNLNSDNVASSTAESGVYPEGIDA